MRGFYFLGFFSSLFWVLILDGLGGLFSSRRDMVGLAAIIAVGLGFCVDVSM